MFPELEAATNLNLVPKLRMREVEWVTYVDNANDLY
jgi:hypothetical protein